jgi:hypothetical protein
MPGAARDQPSLFESGQRCWQGRRRPDQGDNFRNWGPAFRHHHCFTRLHPRSARVEGGLQLGYRRLTPMFSCACVCCHSLARTSSAAMEPLRARAPRLADASGGVLPAPSYLTCLACRCRRRFMHGRQHGTPLLSSQVSETMEGIGPAPRVAAGAAATRQWPPRDGADRHTAYSSRSGVAPRSAGR